MPFLQTYAVQLTSADNLTEYQVHKDYHALRKTLHDTYGEVTQLSIWNVPTGSNPTRYLIYNNGGNPYVVDEAGNPTTFSALETISGDRPGAILQAYNKLISSGRIH